MNSSLTGPDLAAASFATRNGGGMLGELLRFGTVGVAGFIVDAGVLTAGIALGTGPWLGRVLSYLAAATTTFALNRAWTFRASRREGGLGRQWLLFLLVNVLGFLCNYGTYAALVAGVPLVAAHPVIGVAAGSLAGLAANFLMSRRFVFGAAGADPRSSRA
ncbi:GtrA family protein [Belnapia sp. F-4-1]|uniref:GtrA family protein n=1 Tax=Belnapia sp. F-4-1 TaxID=1545443 RepID=UPI001F3CCC24|nr:GtrA family protein [Belnapia sp. F-4-1]